MGPPVVERRSAIRRHGYASTQFRRRLADHFLFHALVLAGASRKGVLMAPLPARQIPRIDLRLVDGDPHLSQEWLVTNGLGGYAPGTVLGALTRRYHGLLVAALPNPLGRTMTLNALSERIRLPNRDVFFAGPNELIGVDPPGTLAPREFQLEGGLPVWRYELGGFVLEKRIFMVYRQNTVHVVYKLLSGPESIRLALRPGIHFRSHDAPVNTPLAAKYVVTITGDNYEVCASDSGFPAL